MHATGQFFPVLEFGNWYGVKCIVKDLLNKYTHKFFFQLWI